jgi:hypothetical protein
MNAEMDRGSRRVSLPRHGSGQSFEVQNEERDELGITPGEASLSERGCHCRSFELLRKFQVIAVPASSADGHKGIVVRGLAGQGLLTKWASLGVGRSR